DRRDFEKPPIHAFFSFPANQIHEVEVEHLMSGLLEEIEEVVMFEAVAAPGITVVVLHRGVQNSHDSTRKLATKGTQSTKLWFSFVLFVPFVPFVANFLTGIGDQP